MKENSQERTIEEACETLKRRLEEAEAIVVGAGAGLSSAAGMSYSGERFRRHFSDFERKYGFHDMYTGGFYPFKSRRNFGRIGADLSISTAIPLLTSRCIKIYFRSLGTRSISF